MREHAWGREEAGSRRGPPPPPPLFLTGIPRRRPRPELGQGRHPKHVPRHTLVRRHQDVQPLAQVQVDAGGGKGGDRHPVGRDDRQVVSLHADCEVRERPRPDEAQAGGAAGGDGDDLVRAPRVGGGRGRVGGGPAGRDGEGAHRAHRFGLAARRADGAVPEKAAPIEQDGLGLVHPHPGARALVLPTVAAAMVVGTASRAPLHDLGRVVRALQADLQPRRRRVVPIPNHDGNVDGGGGALHHRPRQGRVGRAPGRQDHQRRKQAVHDLHGVRVHPERAGTVIDAEPVAQAAPTRADGALVQVGDAVVPLRPARRSHGQAVEVEGEALLDVGEGRRQGVEEGDVKDVAPVQGDGGIAQEAAVDEEDVPGWEQGGGGGVRAGCDAAGGLGFFLSRVPNSSLTETVGRPPGHRHIPHHRHHLAAGNGLVVRQAWHRIGCGGAAGGGGEEEEQANQRAARRAGPAEWLHGAGEAARPGGSCGRRRARAR